MKKIILISVFGLFAVNSFAQYFTLPQIDTIWSQGYLPSPDRCIETWETIWNRTTPVTLTGAGSTTVTGGPSYTVTSASSLDKWATANSPTTAITYTVGFVGIGTQTVICPINVSEDLGGGDNLVGTFFNKGGNGYVVIGTRLSNGKNVLLLYDTVGSYASMRIYGDASGTGLNIAQGGNVGIGTVTPGTAKLAVIGGNVGIGTTSPAMPLSVAYDLGGGFGLEAGFFNPTGDGYIVIGTSISSSQSCLIDYDADLNYASFRVLGDAVGTGVNVIDGGHVGINTANPGTASLGVFGPVGINNSNPFTPLDIRAGLMVETGAITTYTNTNTYAVPASQLVSGAITVNSGTVTLTMPTGTDLGTNFGWTANGHTVSNFTVKNSSGNDVTLVLNTGLTLSAYPTVPDINVLIVKDGDIGYFRIISFDATNGLLQR
jgi:hypothetical protein